MIHTAKRVTYLFPVLWILILISSTVNASPSPLTVHFIDVGQADCILIQSPGGRNMLIDAGNNEDGPLITTYLNTLHIKKLDVIVGTHPHEDHIGSMDTVIAAYKVGKIYLPKVSNNTKSFRDVLTVIKAKGLKVTTAKAGITINLDPALKITMLAPNSTHYDEFNNYSAVIKLTYNRTSFLFSGDAETDSEMEMLAQGYALKADVLKVGHHGSNSSTSPPFLKAVSPKYAVISVGTGNTYGHPHQTTLKRLEAVSRVYLTDRDGSIIMTSNGRRINIRKLKSSN